MLFTFKLQTYRINKRLGHATAAYYVYEKADYYAFKYHVFYTGII